MMHDSLSPVVAIFSFKSAMSTSPDGRHLTVTTCRPAITALRASRVTLGDLRSAARRSRGPGGVGAVRGGGDEAHLALVLAARRVVAVDHGEAGVLALAARPFRRSPASGDASAELTAAPELGCSEMAAKPVTALR